MMKEVCKREKEEGIIPDPDVDTYMKVRRKKTFCLFSFILVIINFYILISEGVKL